MLKRIIALLLCLTMLVSALPSLVFAEETSDENQMMEIPEETTAPAEAVTEPAEETTAPTEAVTEPVEETTAPTEAVTEPEEETTAPTESVTVPVRTESVEKPSIPTELVSESEEVITSPEEVMAGTVQVSGFQSAVMASDYVACGSRLSWHVYEGVLTISGTGPMHDFMPSYIYNTPSLPWRDYSDTITSVVIEDGVTSIGACAFYGLGLSSVSIGADVEEIGNNAFDGCTKLKSVTIPNNVYTLGDYVFKNCTNLQSVSLGKSLTNIGDGVFAGTALTSVRIPENVANMGRAVQGQHAFRLCKTLKKYEVDSANYDYSTDSYGVLYNKDKTTLIRVPSAMTGTYTIPASVTSIDDNAFLNCSLSNIVVASGNKSFYMDSAGVLYQNNKTTLVYALSKVSGKFTIPDGVTSIADRAFMDCRNLTELVFPKSLTVIGYEALYGISVSKLVIPAHITKLDTFSLAGGKSDTTHPYYPSGPYYSNITELYFDGNPPIMYNCLDNQVVTAHYPGDNANWTQSAMHGTSGLVTWVPYDDATSGYLSRCTKYGTYVTLTSNTDDGYIKTLPCSRATMSSSDDVRKQMKGETYTATALYKNTEGNYWYQIKTSSGETGYVFGGNVSTGSLVSGTHISVNVKPSTTTPTKGKPYDITGSVTSTYLDIKSVKGTLKDALGATQTTTITSGFSNIKDSSLNNNLKFGSLCRGPGTLTTVATANYYTTSDGYDIASHSVTATGTAKFTVMETYSVIYDANGGTNAPGSQNKTVGTNLTLTTATPTRTGYDFLGWSTGSTATTASYLPGDTLATDVYSGDLILYAVWGSSTVIASGTCGENAVWVLSKEGVLTISGSGEIDNYFNSSKVPWYDCSDQISSVIIQHGITSIGEYAFSGCSALVNVVIPNSVATIRESAFSYCGGSLTAITIPDSVTTMGDKVFAYCGKLEQVTLSNNLTAIGNQFFYACYALKEITIPESVTSIGEDAFNNCTGLTDITLPKELASIESSAFYKCESLRGITLPDSITNVEFGVFQYCKSLKEIRIPENVVSIGNSAFFYCSGLTDLTIPNSVTTIGASAFNGCTSLTNIQLPKNVTSIGTNAFANCGSPAIIRFAGNAPAIAADTFTNVTATAYYPAGNDTWTTEVRKDYGGSITWASETNKNIIASGSCGGNTTWTLDDQGELVISGTGSTGDYTAFTSPWNGYDSQIRSVVFKDGITRVGDHLLSDSCREITSITFADSVTTIGESAFALCEALTSLTIPGTVKYIGRSAFWANQATTELILCDGIEFIGEGAFESNNLKSVAIPKSVTEIELFAFRFNANMNSITVDVDNPAYASQDGVLFSKDMQHLIQMPENYLGSYTIPETVVAIDTYAFYGTGVRELTIPRSVTFIGDDAFCWGVGLEEIIFEGDAPVIQDYPDNMGTFTGVNATVYYPAGNPTWTSDVMQNYDGNLTWVPVSVYSGICGDNLEWTFDPDTGNLSITGFGDMYHYSNGDTPWAMHSENIRSVTVADGVTNVGEAAFRFCSGLTQVNLPDTITEIAYGAFADCGSLEKFHVPGNVISISYNAFTNCTGLKEVRIPESVAAIGSEAFKNCSSLREVSLPSGVTEIAYATFADCSGLRSVQIPEGVTEIAYSAFDDCSGLQEVTLPAGVTEVAYDAFMDCTGLNRVTLPNNLYSISDGAFRNCVNLTRVVVPDGLREIDSGVFAPFRQVNIIQFQGSAPWIAYDAFAGVTSVAYYPYNNDTWRTFDKQNYGGEIVWQSYGGPPPVENRLILDSSEIPAGSDIWVNGIRYSIQSDGEYSYVDLPAKASSLITYAYNNADASDVHTQYPVSMKVWILEKNEAGGFEMEYVEELEDILQYSGMSIRVTGQKGVRMITSLEKTKKNALTSRNLAGFTLKEYGTVVAWTSQLSDSKPLVLGKSYAKSNYAYRKGTADPVFAYGDDLIQYTNVLVNFTNDQCKKDISMRSYMILENAEGRTITLYGGVVTRSIGYIAYQNRNVFAPGTEAYAYVWEIIHNVYGNLYDQEYQMP